MPERHSSGAVSRRTAPSARLVQLLVLAAVLAVVANDEAHVVNALGAHQGPKVTIVFLACFIGATLGGTILHELGHLVAALLVGLPVVHVSLLPSRGELAHVRFVMQPTRPLLPVKAIFTLLAGPLVNLVVAAEALHLADLPGRSPLWHGALLVVAVMQAGVGIGNLIPMGRVRGMRSDGTQVALWIFQPSRMRYELIMRQVTAALATYTATLRRGEIPDLKVLRAMVDSPYQAVAARAAPVLLSATAKAGRSEFGTDAARLIAATRNPRLTAAAAADLASRIAWFQSNMLIVDMIATQTDSRELDGLASTAATAEYGFAQDPTHPVARYALALVRVMQDQPRAARELLILTDLDALRAVDRANTLLVRALAEVELRDLAQARRLVNAARRDVSGSKGLLPLAEQIIASRESILSQDQGEDEPLDEKP